MEDLESVLVALYLLMPRSQLTDVTGSDNAIWASLYKFG